MAAAKKSRTKPVIIIIVLLLAIAGAFVWHTRQDKNFRYAGTVEATRVDMPSRVATVIDSIDVQEGDRVKQGQALAKLSCEELQIQNRLANDQYRRNAHVHSTGGISDEAYDQYKNRKEDSDMRLSWCTLTSPFDGAVMTKYLEAK